MLSIGRLLVAVGTALVCVACTPSPSSKGATESSGPPAQPASKPASASEVMGAVPVHGNAKVSTQVRYASSSCPGRAPCTCQGSVAFGANALARIGVTAEKLAQGTLCLIADFDANGVDDLAFVDEHFGDPQRAARVQVLLFDEVGLLATAELPKRVQALGLAPVDDGRVALIEPGLTEGRYHFVYSDGGFRYERIEPTP